MIRIAQIQDELLHLVGWEQSYDPQKQIDAALTESESGLTFQQAHLLSIIHGRLSGTTVELKRKTSRLLIKVCTRVVTRAISVVLLR